MENQIQPNIPPFQPTPVVSVPPSTNWSKIIIAILIGLVIVTGSVFTGMQIGKNQTVKQQTMVGEQSIVPSQKTVEPTAILPTEINPTADPTANWKKYINDTYKFNFKYPRSYILTEEPLSNAIYVYLKNDNEKLTFELVKQKEDNYLSRLPTTSSKNYNSNLWNFHESSQYCDAGNCDPTSAGYTTRRDEFLISFTFANLEQTSKIPDQILSTFKFTN